MPSPHILAINLYILLSKSIKICFVSLFLILKYTHKTAWPQTWYSWHWRRLVQTGDCRIFQDDLRKDIQVLEMILRDGFTPKLVKQGLGPSSPRPCSYLWLEALQTSVQGRFCLVLTVCDRDDHKLCRYRLCPQGTTCSHWPVPVLSSFCSGLGAKAELGEGRPDRILL